MDTRYVQRLMFGKYILHKNFFSTSCVWRHYCKVAFLTFWNTLAVPDLVFIWFSLAHSSGFKQFISFNLVLWLLDSIVFLVAVFVCVEFLRWPGVSVCTVCMYEEYMVSLAGVGGWQHPGCKGLGRRTALGLGVTSFSFTWAACCVHFCSDRHWATGLHKAQSEVQFS